MNMDLLENQRTNTWTCTRLVYRYILVIVLLYIYINSVYFSFLGPFVAQHIILLLVSIICLNNKALLFISQNKKLIWLYMLLLIETVIISIGGGDSRPFVNAVLKLAYYCYVPSLLIPYICMHKLSFNKCIIAIGWISGIISTLCFVSSDVSNVLSNMVIINAEQAGQLEEQRGFGIASGITFSYGLVNAFIFAYSLSEKYYKKWYSALFYILLLFATVINTRTSFILQLLFVVVYIMMSKKVNKVKIFAYVAVVSIFIYLYILPIILETSTGDWLMQGFFMTSDYFLDTNMASGNVYTVLESMIIFPQTLTEWILGTGKFIYQKSDIGFILQIYYGGLLYLILLLITYYVTIRPLDNKYMILCAVIMLLIANYKGVYLEYNDGLQFITFIAMYQAYSARLNRKMELMKLSYRQKKEPVVSVNPLN